MNRIEDTIPNSLFPNIHICFYHLNRSPLSRPAKSLLQLRNPLINFRHLQIQWTINM
jgi:hypothetical protein